MISTKSVAAIALICLTFSGAAWLRAEERMRAGLWEIATTYDGKPPGTSRNTCLTPAMVAVGNSPANSLREATEKRVAKSGCTIKDFKLDGNKLSMTQVCGARTLVVSSTYKLDAFDTLATSTEPGESTATHMAGRRIGDCK